MQAEFKTIHNVKTKYYPDTIEWCPTSQFDSYFACGTYQHEEKNKNDDLSPSQCCRKGQIYLFKFDHITKSLKKHNFIETAAILDMKWLHPCPNSPTLAIANGIGQIEIFLLNNKTFDLHACIDLAPENSNLLTLSLDWENVGICSSSHRMLASDSKGYVHNIDYNVNGNLTKIHSWAAHNYEAWICAFDRWRPNIFYSGGDDTLMHVYDLRSSERLLTNKSHTAGVTSILSHSKKEHMLITGSYDERLRMYDTRSLKDPLSDINLKGGIWRLKPDPFDKNLILVACMYENFSLVKLSDNLSTMSLVGVYKEHESICYGVDWCPSSHPESGELFMASCSFYDHKLCLSSIVQTCSK